MTISKDISVAADRQKNLHIQWLRAFAALLVLLFHSTSIFDVARLRAPGFPVFDESWGQFGVSLFFVISGYLMATAAVVQPPFTFLAHRVARIYPTFLIAVALAWAVSGAAHQSFAIDPLALTLVPAGQSQFPLGVEWTLVCEVTFYLSLFALSLAGLARQLRGIALLWLACIAACDALSPLYPALRSYTLTLPNDAPMAAGLLLPVLLRLRANPAIPLCLGVAAFLGLAASDVSRDPSPWWLALAATLVAMGTIGLSARRPDLGDTRAGRLFARLGDYSYALYLCHCPIAAIVFTATAGRRIPFVAEWAAVVAGSLLVACLLGELDVRLYAVLKRRLGRLPRLARAVAIGYVALFATTMAVAWLEARAAERDVLTRQEMAGLIGRAGGKDADAAFTAAGLRRSQSLVGVIDSATWSGGALTVRGWALDRDRGHAPVSVALFQDGHMLGSTPAIPSRPDVARLFRTLAPTGFAWTGAAACLPDKPLVAVEFTSHGEFAILSPSGLIVPCRP